MIIQTERLTLRPFVNEDVYWYFDLVQDEEVQKRLPGLIVVNKEQAKQDIEIFEKSDFVNDFYYVIEDKANNVMGIIVAVRITTTDIDVSYFLSKQYRHNGYMREALDNFIKTVKKRNTTYRFRMVVDDDNAASLNLLKSFGNVNIKADNKYICYL